MWAWIIGICVVLVGTFAGLVPWGARVVARDTLSRVDPTQAKEVPISYTVLEREIGRCNRSWGRESKARAAYLRRVWVLAERINNGTWQPAAERFDSCAVRAENQAPRRML